MAYGVSYTMNPIGEIPRPRRYRAEELFRMSTYQLRDICETDTIISPILNQLRKPDLIDLILTFRGSHNPMLIKEDIEGGNDRVSSALSNAKIHKIKHNISFSAKLTVFEGLDTNFFDEYTVPYDEQLDGVNAVMLDNTGGICAIFSVESYPHKKDLYITRSGKLPCHEAELKDYRLLVFPRELSDEVYRVYCGERVGLSPEIFVYSIKLLDFIIMQPRTISMPLAIDFGTTNTVAGLFVDNQFYYDIKNGIKPGQIEADAINYVQYLSPDGEITPVLPTIIGVAEIKDGKPIFHMGHDGEKMVTDGYMGEGFCVFYDIKRWVGDYEKEEELSDAFGNHTLMRRADIIKAFLEYVIENAEQRFKCKFQSVFLCYPVKQKGRFLSLFRDILPNYQIPADDLIDEGVAVLYNTIANFIDHNIYADGVKTKAMIIDCGGGTTDLSSCEFTIANKRVSYDIDIVTAYENGDTDFGGNNLTFRILQLLKIQATHLLTGTGKTIDEIVNHMELDTYRVVDELGKSVIYEELEEAYRYAEQTIPTRFKDYEYATREEYFMVRNNYYYLFSLAERIKKAFFTNTSLLQLTTTSEAENIPDTIFAKRWKLAVKRNNHLSIIKMFPNITIGSVMLNTVLGGDIYEIVQRFLNPPYQSGELSEYKVINMTGQSVKIGLFRDALKEFIPGKLIRGKKENKAQDYRLKLTCIEGAIRYISDKRLGYAKVNITSKEPSLPYILHSNTHTGEEVVLVHPLNREMNYGAVSRAIQSVELRLLLSDTQGEQKYIYNVFCTPDEFEDKTYEEIEALHGSHIPQPEVDVIENDEVRYFVWVDKENWGFNVVPVARFHETLKLGRTQFLSFENDSWLLNYFNGEH